MARKSSESFIISTENTIPNVTIDTQNKNEIIENFILIWLDKNINKASEEYRSLIDLFQRYVNSIILLSDQVKYANLIDNINDEKLFIIVSGSFGSELAHSMEVTSAVHSVYVYCNKKEVHEKWAKNFRKVKGVYTGLRPISDALRRDIRQVNSDLTPINIFSPTNADQSFVCSLLLKEILINSESNEQLKKDFIEFARCHYSENHFELDVINQYDKNTSNQISSIEWYTRECFIYSMINRALRLYDITILPKIAFFVRDLHQQITELHKKSNEFKKLTVYHAQGISSDQFEKLKTNLNNFISFNTFLLTTIDREPSLDFAKQSGNDPDLVTILFHIDIDRSMSSFPFISLDALDYHRDTDRHILFSLNATFRITNIELLTKNLFQINLILINDNEDTMKKLTNSVRKDIRNSKGFVPLAQMMIKMNKLEKAKRVFEISLKNTTENDKKQLAYMHRTLGSIDQKMENYTSALSHYKECLKTQLSYLPPEDRNLLATFVGVGAISEKLGDHDQAIEYYQRAIDNSRHVSESDSSVVSTYYIGIGRILHIQGKNREAREKFQHALKLQQKSRKPNGNLLAEINHYLSVVP